MTRIHSTHNRDLSERFKGISEFETIDELGKGGYSVVYLVRHKKTNKKYALKCAHKYKKGKDRSERTRQEIEVLSKMRHRAIIKLSGWFEDAENIYIVLQYVSGRDLSKYFRKTLPSRENTIEIIRQLVDAVKYCHHHGIIHRDMKLENILISDNMKIKLTDFGLCAIRRSRDEYFTDEVGTARYTSPDLLQGDGYNELIDVWGIGIILFMLLTCLLYTSPSPRD